ncbi:MAG: hypothetical protein ABIW34_13350 [Ginsengibacter sp.]
MKRIVISSCLFLFMLTANQVMAQDKVKEKEDKTKIKDDNYKEKIKDEKIKIKDGDSKIKMKNDNGMMMDYPYTANYSSKFAMGNPAHAKMILDLWKDWDDNAFNRHDYMADTVVMFFPDGTMAKGKQQTMEGAMKYRGGMTSAKSSIDAWMPLRSTDKNEDWVAVWGSETDTWADGKTETRDIHEIWRINKDGKVDFMKQFTAKPQPPPAK